MENTNDKKEIITNLDDLIIRAESVRGNFFQRILRKNPFIQSIDNEILQLQRLKEYELVFFYRKRLSAIKNAWILPFITAAIVCMILISLLYYFFVSSAN